MAIWMVTTPEDHDSMSIPYDWIEAETASDALTLLSKEFHKDDWPHLVAYEIDAGIAVTKYAKMNRQYRDEKRPWDDALSEAHSAALEEW